MEKINIAELLKDCPKGMELDCTMFDNVTFVRVDYEREQFPIEISISGLRSKYLTKDGCFHDTTLLPEAKSVIFPKGKTTWEGFVPPGKFKDGDVIVDKQGTIAIYKQVHKSYEEPCVDFHCRIYQGNKNLFYTNFVKGGSLEHCGAIDSARFATEEEKQKLFDAIKANGYKWNETTKTLEKLVKPKFKAGDKVVKKDGITIPVLITKVGEEFYSSSTENSVGFFSIKDQDYWELATPVKPKFKVGDIIRHRLTGEVYKVLFVLSNGCGGGVYDVAITNEIGKSIDIKEQDNYELAVPYPTKFDITTLVTFESKVLCRDGYTEKWKSNFWGFYDNAHAMNYPFECCGTSYAQCIPYEGNEHLLGTTDDCDDFYKTWEF